MKIKLQFALDDLNLSNIFDLAHETISAGIDILEIGTPIIKRYGLRIIEELHHKFPLVPLYADSKMIDFPEYEIADFFKAGSAYVSAMIFINNKNIIKSLEISSSFKGNIVFSTMGYPIIDLSRRVNEIIRLGAQFFIAHGSGHLVTNAFKELKEKISLLSNIIGIRLIAAGGINEENIKEIFTYHPEIIIVGRGISCSNDIFSCIKKLKRIINKK